MKSARVCVKIKAPECVGPGLHEGIAAELCTEGACHAGLLPSASVIRLLLLDDYFIFGGADEEIGYIGNSSAPQGGGNVEPVCRESR